jgi:DoxX-like family
VTEVFLWVLQVLLALVFLGIGYSHALSFDRMAAQPRTIWMLAVGQERMRIIGILEILGAIGLILPALTGILPWLTPLAASALALLMIFAIAFHLRRPGERANIAFNVALGIVALMIAVGRLIIEPFA